MTYKEIYLFLHIFIVFLVINSRALDKIIIRKLEKILLRRKKYNHSYSSAVKRSELISFSLEIVDPDRSQNFFMRGELWSWPSYDSDQTRLGEGVKMAARETEDNAYAKFWGEKQERYGML